jgi:hypothetical protein
MPAKPAHAITWCHDYTLYEVTGRDQNRTSVARLRVVLGRDLRYKRFPFTHAAHDPKAQRSLNPGDVVVIGDAHSGVVNRRGLIDHFVQAAGAVGKAHRPQDVPALKTFHRDWTLFQIVNFERVYADGRVQYPYRNLTVEVWRKVP